MTKTAIKYANQICYSNVRAHYIVRVISNTTMEVRRVRAERDNWEPRPIVRIRKSRALRTMGQWFDAAGYRYEISDEPREYYDYNV